MRLDFLLKKEYNIKKYKNGISKKEFLGILFYFVTAFQVFNCVAFIFE